MTSIVEENGSSTIDNFALPEAVGAPGPNNNNNHSPHPHLPPPQALQPLQGHSPVPSSAVLSASANIVQIIPSQQQTSSHQVNIG